MATLYNTLPTQLKVNRQLYHAVSDNTGQVGILAIEQLQSPFYLGLRAHCDIKTEKME